MVKRVLLVVGLVMVLFIAVVVGGMIFTLTGNPPIIDGQLLGGGAVRVVKDGYVSAAMLDDGDGTVSLIDAGNDAEGKALLAELARRRLGPDAVKAIFLTHGHADHVAGAHLFPRATVYALPQDVALAEGREKTHGPLTQLFPVKDSHLKVGQELADGQAVTVGQRVVRVFAVPGHTAGSAAYLVEGVLFLGDSADATKEGKLAPAKRLMSDDAPLNVRSLKTLAGKLKPSDVTTLECAHTGTLWGLQPLTDLAARTP